LERLGKCERYLEGRGQVKVYVPAQFPTCQFCPLLACQTQFNRYYCRLTDEWILNYNKERGTSCPLEWEEKE